MRFLSMGIRKFAFVGVLASLFIVFVFIMLLSGPLASVLVTAATTENQSITPALFGVGTVEVRYRYKIGPTAAGRVKQVVAHVGDYVRSGQLLGEMDPVDLSERAQAQRSSIKRGEADLLAVKAQVSHASARHIYADKQAARYEKLWKMKYVSKDQLEGKQQERQAANATLVSAQANLKATQHNLVKLRADLKGLSQQRAHLQLISPVDGLVVARDINEGTTVVAGQPVIEIIEPKSLWINVRFNQTNSCGLKAGLPAHIVLRSRAKHTIAGKVLRVEPLADPVTEETLVKVVFNEIPKPLPFIGELAEVTVSLPALPAAPVVSNASIHRINHHLGVWLIKNGKLQFVAVKIGLSDLDGRVQILSGLTAGDRVIVYSQGPLKARSRFKIVKNLPGTML